MEGAGVWAFLLVPTKVIIFNCNKSKTTAPGPTVKHRFSLLILW